VTGDFNGGFINWNTDVTLKNFISGAHSATGSQGWSYSDATATGNTMTLDNVYLAHTFWIFVQSNGYAGNNLHVKNSYFVNMNGNGCRRNGGVYDNTANNTKEVIVENSTHVMGAGMIYKFRTFPIDKVVFNHNTFVNIANAPISTAGYQTDMIVTNNLFVNTNVQAYYPGLDDNETDQDHLFTGIINVDSLNSVRGIAVADTFFTDKFANANPSEWAGLREILVDGNAVYWSPELGDIAAQTQTENAGLLDTLDGGAHDGELVNAMETMNSRTQAMFNNDSEWPLLTEGTWYEGDPGFTEDFGLLDESAWLGDFIEFTVKSLDGGNALALASMRTEGNPADVPENFAFPDWPIPVDLSYSNSTFLEGAYGDLPVGDLNWFPSIKATWDGEAELAELETAKENGDAFTTSVERGGDIPNSIKLEQNYPNPFNPTTKISFNMPKAQEVTLKVYDMLGREVATLLNNEFAVSGQNSVTFDASNLASGVYIYRLHGDNFSYSKSMTLMK
ncbi:MAG: T9SS type A sorting domain-containing protein, partial [Candidatus Paceibacterota bacterium]